MNLPLWLIIIQVVADIPQVHEWIMLNLQAYGASSDFMCKTFKMSNGAEFICITLSF